MRGRRGAGRPRRQAGGTKTIAACSKTLGEPAKDRRALQASECFVRGCGNPTNGAAGVGTLLLNCGRFNGCIVKLDGAAVKQNETDVGEVSADPRRAPPANRF